MSALKDPQGLDSYESACRFRETADAAREPSASPQPDTAPRHVPEQARSDERERPEPDHS
jgi:hypothetical protein